MIGILSTIAGGAIAIYGCYLMATSVVGVWGDQCPECGYSYRGLPQATPRCPECGSQVNRTMQGYVERHPERFIIGLLTLLFGSTVFGLGFLI